MYPSCYTVQESKKKKRQGYTIAQNCLPPQHSVEETVLSVLPRSGVSENQIRVRLISGLAGSDAPGFSGKLIRACSES